LNKLIERFIAESTICQGHPQIDGSYFDTEKFAELIVRECAKQCLSDDSMRILNHMGVKGVEE
jgi:hypothetical protein